MKNKSVVIVMIARITCSVCHQRFDFEYAETRNRTVIIDDLRRKGFRIGKYAVCPDCRKRYHMMLEGRMEK